MNNAQLLIETPYRALAFVKNSNEYANFTNRKVLETTTAAAAEQFD